MSKKDTSNGNKGRVVPLFKASRNKADAPNSPQNENPYLPRLQKISNELHSLCADEKIAKFELASIRSLIAYTAQMSGLHEDVVRSMTAAHFGLSDILDMHRDHFEEAVRYLVDFDAKQAVN